MQVTNDIFAFAVVERLLSPLGISIESKSIGAGKKHHTFNLRYKINDIFVPVMSISYDFRWTQSYWYSAKKLLSSLKTIQKFVGIDPCAKETYICNPYFGCKSLEEAYVIADLYASSQNAQLQNEP